MINDTCSAITSFGGCGQPAAHHFIGKVKRMVWPMTEGEPLPFMFFPTAKLCKLHFKMYQDNKEKFHDGF